MQNFQRDTHCEKRCATIVLSTQIQNSGHRDSGKHIGVSHKYHGTQCGCYTKIGFLLASLDSNNYIGLRRICIPLDRVWM